MIGRTAFWSFTICCVLWTFAPVRATQGGHSYYPGGFVDLHTGNVTERSMVRD